MSNKYDVSSIRDAERTYDISDADFYTHTVEKAALKFLSEKIDDVKELLIGYDQFGRDSEPLDNYYVDNLLDSVTGEKHAALVKSSSSYELETDDSLLSAASRAFAEDVFDRACSIYESMSEEYGNLIESMDDVLSGFKNGTLQLDEDDSLHLVVLSGIAQQNGYEGDLSSVLRQFRADTVDYSAGSEAIELAQKFACELAYNSTWDDVNRQLFPEAAKPGSIEEAAMISHFLIQEDKFAGMAHGGALGDHYLDSRTDPELEVRIFRTYTDDLAQRVLGQYVPPIENIGLHDEAKALSSLGLKGSEIAAFVTRHLVAPVDDLPYQATTAKVNDVMGKITAGTVKASDYVELAKNRDLHHVYASDVKTYFAVMHPEMARQVHLELKQDLQSLAATMVGLMEGSPSAQRQFANWQQELNEAIPAPTKSLLAFRRSVYPEQEQKLDGPSVR